MKLLTSSSLRSKLNAQHLSKLNKFWSCMKQFSNTFQSLTFLSVLRNLQNHSFLYPEVENIWKDIDKSKKTVFFEDMVHSIDGHDLVTHVVLNGGNIFYLWSQRHQPKLWKTFRSFETLQWIQILINIIFLMTISILPTSIWTAKC